MKALIIEDADEVIETISLLPGIRWPDCTIVSTREGREAIHLVEIDTPDIAILDLSLPDQNGLDVLREIRHFSDTAIMVVMTSQDEMEKVKGLEPGADDFMIKPFLHTELLARVKGVPRRTRMPQLRHDDSILTLPGLVIDFAERRLVLDGGEEHFLTPMEWNLLYRPSRNGGRVIPYTMLAEKVWGTEYVTLSAMLVTALSAQYTAR